MRNHKKLPHSSSTSSNLDTVNEDMEEEDEEETATSEPIFRKTPRNIPSLSITASAPGKLILFGEHAVVHAQPAIAASLSDLRIHTHLKTRRDGVLSIRMPDLPLETPLHWNKASILASMQLKHADDIRHYLQIHFPEYTTNILMALVPLLYLIRTITPMVLTDSVGLTVCIVSAELPVGAGLGSSAAFSVATSAALLRLRDRIEEGGTASSHPTEGELEQINHFAYQSEKLIHGTPSGIDNTISCFGGAMYFQKDPCHIVEKETIQNFPDMNVLLIHTGIPRSTKILVSLVKEKKQEFPTVIQGIFDAIGGISRQFQDETGCDDAPLTFTRLSWLVKTNQLLLQALGVSHPMLEKVCSLTHQYGAATKLTGAGGGGCAVAFLPDEKCGQVVKSVVEREMGLECYITQVGGDGVLYEPSDEGLLKEEEDERGVWKRRVLRVFRSTVVVVGIGFLLNTVHKRRMK